MASAKATPSKAALLRVGERLLLVALAATALALLAGSATGSTVPPPTGDWVIDPLENASLEGQTTVVQGNITVGGTLFVGNGSLELAPTTPGAVAEILVASGAHLRLEGSVVLAAGPSSFVIRVEPGGRLDASASLLDGLGAVTTSQLSGVGLVLRGATAHMKNVTLVNASGGLGAQEGSVLTGSNVSATVRGRALYATGGSAVSLRGFWASGDLSQTDYLVIVEGSSIDVDGGSFQTAPVAVLSLSSVVSFRNVSLGTVGDVGVIAVSSTVLWRGGILAPHARAAFESYGSDLDLEVRFFNVTIGTVLIESTLSLSNSTFNASGDDPKGSFAVVYARDSSARVVDSNLSGTFWVTDVPRTINGTPTLVPVYACGTSAVWSIRSAITVERTSTECFDTHVQAEDSSLFADGITMVNGTEGIRMLRGTIDASNLSGSLFTGPNSVLVTAFDAEGRIDGLESLGNSIAVEITSSDLRIDHLTFQSPGLGVLVVSGSPTINGSSFLVHNATAVEVRSGSPTISNSTFWLSADRFNATGVFVQGGSPTIHSSTFLGTPPRALTYGVWSWSGSSPTIRGSSFSGLERAAVMYARGFRMEGNRVEACNQGFEAREHSSGAIVGNTFTNLTALGAGNAVRIYLASTLVASNSFDDVNYGVQIFSASVEGDTRVSGNSFSNVAWFAIQVLNSTRPVLIDNNSVRAAAKGAVELFRAPAVGSYNIFVDGDGYGYWVIETDLTIIGDRLENLSLAVEARDGTLTIRYATFSRNAVGVFAQDTPTSIRNSSFQSNALAVEFPNGALNEVHDSLFLANVDAILAFNSAAVDVRDTSFLRTLGYIVSCEQNSTANVNFTRRGEISGGTLKLRGNLTSDAEFLRISNVRFQFQPITSGVPSVMVRGALELFLEDLDLTNSSVPYRFEVADSNGTLLDTSFVAPYPDPSGEPRAPLVERSSLVIRNLRIEDGWGTPSFVDSDIVASNLTVRNSRAGSLYLEGGSFILHDGALLDGNGCGVVGVAGAVFNATSATVRGHPNGSLCGDDLTAAIFQGDLASGGVDVNLTGASNVGIWSTLVSGGWDVQDESVLTRGWRISVTVSLSNPALLPAVNVAVSDFLGRRTVAQPNRTGAVTGLPYFPEYVVRATTSTLHSPYTVSATLDPLATSTDLYLDRDTLVQLTLDDILPPTVSIQAPSEGQIFGDPEVTISLSASDQGTGVRDLSYRFGSGTPVTLPSQNADHVIVRFLVDGLHTLTVRAVDHGGNEAEASVNFTIDTLAPLISVNSPRGDPFFTRDTTVLVRVGLDPDVVRVTIGGEEVPIGINSANRTVSVPEGVTLIEIVATDRAGNVGNASVTVDADRTAPVLEVANRQDSNVTIESFVVVRGTSEEAALVLVQGVPVTTVNGTFEALVPLAIGQNPVDIRARDALGNENSTSLLISRGVLEPSQALDLSVMLLGVALLGVGAVLLVRSFLLERESMSQAGRRPRRGDRP